MKFGRRTLLSASLLLQGSLLVQAVCPGETPCSGHGSCGAWDLCTCYPNWQGYDCAERTCPYGKAWADVKDTSVSGRNEHHYMECSGKGTCDRESGQCECFEGFEGKGCRRMSCPEDCNGHGTCELMSEVNAGYDAWDAAKIQVCKCDAGWTGVSCASRMCKPGDDPLTLYTAGGSAYQANEVQTLAFTDSGAGALTGEFTLTYTDWRGKAWTTHAIDIATATAITVEEALEALPNLAIPDITVAMATDDAANGDISFTITFNSDATPGNQEALVVNWAGCSTAGCQPVYSGVTSAGTTAATVTETTAGTEEKIECSRRGTCNPDNGLCECFNGYYGEACQFQTIIT